MRRSIKIFEFSCRKPPRLSVHPLGHENMNQFGDAGGSGSGRRKTTINTANINQIMKTKVIILALALGASTCPLTAQDANPPDEGQRPPPREGGVERDGDRPENSETLTDAQKEQVKAILSKYDANTLTADQAKAIHEAFRQAGLRGGPAMADTIKAAGFDPDKLRDLAPPPDRAGGEDRRPPRPADDRDQGKALVRSAAEMDSKAATRSRRRFRIARNSAPLPSAGWRFSPGISARPLSCRRARCAISSGSSTCAILMPPGRGTIPCSSPGSPEMC